MAGAVFTTLTSAVGIVTVSVAVAGTVLLPSEPVTPPAGMVFTKVPPLADVTLIFTVQLDVGKSAPPTKETLPAVLVTVPPQVFTKAGVAARTIPEPGVVGNTSVNVRALIPRPNG